jgi:hypothetical protein
MTQAFSRYADWKAPADDGQMLIWPNPGALVTQTLANQAALSRCDALIQGTPLRELRSASRKFIGHPSSQPLVATGHQTELYHPGVWVKNALINSIAHRAGGEAFHFAVDTDAPKHLHLRWPGGSQPLTDDPELVTAEWTSLLSTATPAHLSDLMVTFASEQKEWEFTSSMGIFFDSMRHVPSEGENLSTALVNGTHAVEWDLGLRHHAMVTSPLWQSESYSTFLHHVLANADQFASIYNAALAEYRENNGVRTTARPMPDLSTTADEIELPFWIDDLATGRRARASVQKHETGWALVMPDGDRFPADRHASGQHAAAALVKWCREKQIRIAPRALTLTMFFRLFLADQFVHGIGGGRYDQVTDAVIEKFFNIPAPAFSVTTATLFFPAAAGKRRVNLHPLLQEGRRIRHGLLSAEKRGTVNRINALPRRSPQRQELFFSMHQRLAAESNGPAVRQWEQKLRAAEHEVRAEKVLFDRELFFAIQPRDRLLILIKRYDAAMS